MATIQSIQVDQPEPQHHQSSDQTAANAPAPLTLAHFASLPANLRPSRVDTYVHRASPLQTAAWRRLGELLARETTRRALEVRAHAASEACAAGAESAADAAGATVPESAEGEVRG